MVIGANSIAAYVFADGGIKSLLHKSLYTRLGQNFDKLFGQPYAPLVSGAITLFLLWLILNWMHRKKIFKRI